MLYIDSPQPHKNSLEKLDRLKDKYVKKRAGLPPNCNQCSFTYSFRNGYKKHIGNVHGGKHCQSHQDKAARRCYSKQCDQCNWDQEKNKLPPMLKPHLIQVYRRSPLMAQSPLSLAKMPTKWSTSLTQKQWIKKKTNICWKWWEMMWAREKSLCAGAFSCNGCS